MYILKFFILPLPSYTYLILHSQSHLVGCRLVSANEAKQRLGQCVHFQDAAAWQPSFRTVFWKHIASEKQICTQRKGFVFYFLKK